jgi:hypothetical protein
MEENYWGKVLNLRKEAAPSTCAKRNDGGCSIEQQAVPKTHVLNKELLRGGPDRGLRDIIVMIDVYRFGFGKSSVTFRFLLN